MKTTDFLTFLCDFLEHFEIKARLSVMVLVEKAQLTVRGGLFGVVWMQSPACAPALVLSSLVGSQLGAGLNND